MRIPNLIYKLAFVGIAAAAFTSCKKENGIDNDTVIKKPYGLYVADSEGSLLNTNDGNLFRAIFPPDGYPPRAIAVSGNNLIWVKSNVHVSTDNGKNFNPEYFFANPLGLWQPVIYNVPSHGRIYLASIEPGSLGVSFSDDNGETWFIDYGWDDGVAAGGISSFAQLKNGQLFARSADSLYQRDGKDDKWTHVKPVNQPAGMGFLSHYNNSLMFVDYTGANGVQGSGDGGVNWTSYSGLPQRPLLSAASPFDQTFLVGTDSMGIYRLDQNGQFVPTNNGLEMNTSVYAITAKDDIYKNNTTKRYVYIATDKGVYRSEDLGQNWYRVKEGDYRAIY